MIFQHTWKLILEDKKTETRRPVKPGERTLFSDDTNTLKVLGANGRVKWEVGKTYAVQPGRGKPGIIINQHTPDEHPARIRILWIKQHPLYVMSEADFLAEGFENKAGRMGYRHISDDYQTLIGAEKAGAQFENTWRKAHPYGPYRWENNPLVWVITFERVGYE